MVNRKLIPLHKKGEKKTVVYFDQRLGAAHSKTLVEIVIFGIFAAKKENAIKIMH